MRRRALAGCCGQMFLWDEKEWFDLMHVYLLSRRSVDVPLNSVR